jgi:predicted amidophosphoribosyltransferase
MVLQTTSITCRYSSFRHYYLCHYLPLSAGKDMISRSLLKFKHRTRPDFNTWIECSLEALHEISLTSDTIILRALHHDEMVAGTKFPTALDFLGHALAGHFGCRYLPSLLRKSRPARPCKELSRHQRKTELQGIYSLDSAARQMIATPAPNPPFLLIDDILTTGTTMRMIIRTLRRTFPLSPIRIFTLARANDDPPAAADHPPAVPPLPPTPPSPADTPRLPQAIQPNPPQDTSPRQ